MKFRIALLQFNIEKDNTARNLNKVRQLFEMAAEKADAVILPELFNCDFAENYKLLAESSKGKTVKAVSGLCKEYHMALLNGSFIEKKDGRFYNTSLACDKNGNILAKYRKVHLFNGEVREKEMFTSGDEWLSFDFDGINIGMLNCFDLRFPVFARNLTLRGAEILTLCAQWPAARLQHWRILLQARAIENEVWVIACNACGGEDVKCAGHSAVIAPDGRIVAEAGEGEEILTAEIDTDIKGYFDILNLRKPILDEIDENQL